MTDDDDDFSVPFIEKNRRPETPRESTVESKSVRFAMGHGWLTKKIGTNGWPDRMFLRLNRAVFIEFKRQGKKPRPAQIARLEEIRREGFETYVIDTFEEAKRVLA